MRLNHKALEVLVPKAAGSLMLMTTRAMLNFMGKACRAVAENKKVLLVLTLSQMASLLRIAHAPAKQSAAAMLLEKEEQNINR